MMQVTDSALMQIASSRTLADRGLDKTVYAVKVRSLAEGLRASKTPASDQQHDWRDLSPNTEDEVAAKRFSSSIHEEFENERDILEHLSSLKNDRIVQLLASHHIHNDYFLIFPLAQSNLRDYWTHHDASSNFPTYTAWFINEARNLMHALSAIHHIPHHLPTSNISPPTATQPPPAGIIHGDIKPRNILLFSQPPPALPILKWNDFGLSTYTNAPQATHTTRTYDAPENGLRLALGPKSDVWSFGCVLLEFAIWLLYGNDAVEAFGNKRSQRTHGSRVPLKDDHFYTLVFEERRAVGVVVRDAVVEWLRDISGNQRSVGELGRVVRLLGEGMLVVDEGRRRSSMELASALSEGLDMDSLGSQTR